MQASRLGGCGSPENGIEENRAPFLSGNTKSCGCGRRAGDNRCDTGFEVERGLRYPGQAHGRWRDTAKVIKIGETWYDETPFGFAESTASGEDQLQMFEMGDGARGADFSSYQMYHFKADITSQIDKYNQAKAGYEFQYAKIENRVKSTAGGTSWLPAPGTVPS